MWVNVGNQQPESAEIAMENSTIPDCSMDNGMYSYSGLDTTAEQVFSHFLSRVVICKPQEAFYVPLSTTMFASTSLYVA